VLKAGARARHRAIRQQERIMRLNFSPQFHLRLSGDRDRHLWVAAPRPRTLIAAKAHYYIAWQREEGIRLQNAGEEVIALPISY
jgi:hypothetical protein